MVGSFAPRIRDDEDDDDDDDDDASSTRLISTSSPERWMRFILRVSGMSLRNTFYPI